MAISSIKSNPHVAVDTAILLSGIVWPRWPREVLRHALNNDFQLVLSPYLINEARCKFKEKFSAHLPDFETFLDDCNYEEIPDPSDQEVEANLDLMRDLDDIPIALAAIKAQVDYFVSEDKDFTSHDPRTAQLHGQLNIMLSGTFLREVMGWSSEDLERVRGRNWEDIERN